MYSKVIRLRRGERGPPATGARLIGAMLDGIDTGEIATDEAVGMLMQLFTAGTTWLDGLVGGQV